MKRLNNRGQVLVLFIVLLPVLLFVVTLVYDVGNAIYEKDNICNIDYLTTDYALDNIDKVSDEDIVNLIKKNDDSILDISILIIDNSVTIGISKDIRGVIGKTFNFNLTSVNCKYKGYFDDNGNKMIERVK